MIDEEWAAEFTKVLIGRNPRDCSAYLIDKIIHPDNGVNNIKAFWVNEETHSLSIELEGGDKLSITMPPPPSVSETMELIAEQQIELRQLKGRNRSLEKGMLDISAILYCIGGPLNDNKYNLNKEQLKDFIRIEEILSDFEEQ